MKTNSQWREAVESLEGVRPYEDGYERDSVHKLIDAGDELQAKLDFIQDEYGKEMNEKLTRDALCLKIAALEQKLKEIKKIYDKYEDPNREPSEIFFELEEVFGS